MADALESPMNVKSNIVMKLLDKQKVEGSMATT